MSLLISAADVKAVYETDRSDAAIAPFLAGAQALSDARLSGKLSPTLEKECQRYLAAHLLFVADTGVHDTLRIEDVAETFTSNGKQPGLLDSRFGRMAVSFDSTGILAGISRNQLPALLRLVLPCDDKICISEDETPVSQTLGGSSIIETSGAGTSFILQGAGATESFWTLTPHTGLRLRFNRTAAPGVGCSIVYTLRRNGVDTEMTVTLGAAAVSGESSAAITVGFVDGDRFSIKQVRTGACAAGEDTWTYEYST